MRLTMTKKKSKSKEKLQEENEQVVTAEDQAELTEGEKEQVATVEGNVETERDMRPPSISDAGMQVLGGIFWIVILN
jgi:hypothetical protein